MIMESQMVFKTLRLFPEKNWSSLVAVKSSSLKQMFFKIDIGESR